MFLVINRLEEFAAAVNDRLNTLEFNTKREIIRALVKRIEIHHQEIVVVFRVDPDPDIGDGNGENEPGKSNQTSSMQDCKRRYFGGLRRRGDAEQQNGEQQTAYHRCLPGHQLNVTLGSLRSSGFSSSK
ncbi:MAG: hypothetical protein WBM40_21500 [Thiohalocapsa sp.]